jgi:hypothetical protein
MEKSLEFEIAVVKRGAAPTSAVRFSIGRKRSGTGTQCVACHELGNPFFLRYEEERGVVVRNYALWLLDQIKKNNRPVCEALNALVVAARKGNVELECFCAPKLCHADVIRLVLLVVLEHEVGEREALVEKLEVVSADLDTALAKVWI